MRLHGSANFHSQKGRFMSGNDHDEKTVSSGRTRINIGLIVFIVIFIYIISNLVAYLTREHISIFEVEAGEIVDEDVFSGVVLRNEEVVKAKAGGYINFYISDGEKAAKNSNVCVITKADSAKKDNTANSENTFALTRDDYSSIREQIIDYNKKYSDSNFTEISTLDYRLTNVVGQIISRTNITNLGRAASSSYEIMKAEDNGLISYSVDGMESMTESDINDNSFQSGITDRSQISAGSFINVNEPAYKIIHDDAWEIVISPSQEQLDKLRELETVDVTIIRDNLTTSAQVHIFDSNGKTYVGLILNNYMIRYCNDRYLDVQLLWSSYSGYKIPASSITSLYYYMIPAEYLVADEKTSQSGFYFQDGSDTVFKKPEIVMMTDGYCYVDTNDIKEGAVVIQPDSGASYQVGTTAALTGVYNINQGYARFTLVKVLHQYGDYCIVDPEESNSLSIYDHIILNGESVSNGEFIY